MALEFQVTYDCSDPAVLADFWSAALGYEREVAPEGFKSWEDYAEHMGLSKAEMAEGASIVDPNGHGPRMYFQLVPEKKVMKNRAHLDIDASEGMKVSLEQRKRQVEAEAARFESLGARRVKEYEEQDHYHVTMQDPEGNEFCLR